MQNFVASLLSLSLKKANFLLEQAVAPSDSKNHQMTRSRESVRLVSPNPLKEKQLTLQPVSMSGVGQRTMVLLLTLALTDLRRC